MARRYEFGNNYVAAKPYLTWLIKVLLNNCLKFWMRCHPSWLKIQSIQGEP